MTPSISRLSFVSLLALGMTLAACDAPANDSADAEAQDSLPVASSPMPAAPSVESDVEEAQAGSSMAEDSPGGETVTETELPQSDVPPPSREVFVNAECDFEAWVGKPVNEAAVKETGRDYRILKPGSMMTMDHSPQRINVEHDDDGTVMRVWCG